MGRRGGGKPRGRGRPRQRLQLHTLLCSSRELTRGLPAAEAALPIPSLLPLPLLLQAAAKASTLVTAEGGSAQGSATSLAESMSEWALPEGQPTVCGGGSYRLIDRAPLPLSPFRSARRRHGPGHSSGILRLR